MKKLISLFLALPMIFALCACGQKAAAEPEFSAVCDAVAAAVPASGDMVARDADYIKNMVGLDSTAYSDALVMTTNVGTSRDEYGVFKCADAKAAEAAKTSVEAYLQQCIDTMMGYTPEELPKLENAKVLTSGSYVMYAVLEDEALSAAEGAFTSAFAK